MSYIAGKLKHKIHIFQAVDAPDTDSGRFIRSYRKLITLWAGKKNIGNFLMAIRGVNSEKYNSNAPISTDEFMVRWSSAVSKFYRTFETGFEGGFDSLENNGMGKAFSEGYDNGFNSLADIYPIKTDYFLFLQYGNTDAYRGRLYKIDRVVRDDNHKEVILLKCTEVEEQGLGAIS